MIVFQHLAFENSSNFFLPEFGGDSIEEKLTPGKENVRPECSWRDQETKFPFFFVSPLECMRSKEEYRTKGKRTQPIIH